MDKAEYTIEIRGPVKMHGMREYSAVAKGPKVRALVSIYERKDEAGENPWLRLLVQACEDLWWHERRKREEAAE